MSLGNEVIKFKFTVLIPNKIYIFQGVGFIDQCPPPPLLQTVSHHDSIVSLRDNGLECWNMELLRYYHNIVRYVEGHHKQTVLVKLLYRELR